MTIGSTPMPWQMLRLQRQSAGDHRGRQSDENCTSGPFSGASSHGIVQHTVAEQKSACTSHRPLEQKGTRTPCLAHKPLGVFKRRLRGLVTRSEKRPQKLKIKLADGKERAIQHMMATTFWSADGKPMSAAQFIERLLADSLLSSRTKTSCELYGASRVRERRC